MADTFGPFEVLATNDAWTDPAIDGDADGPEAGTQRLAEYRRTRDVAVLRLRDGVTPTLFVVKPLGATYIASVVDTFSGDTFRHVMSFMASCHEIRRADGSRLEPAGKLAKSVKGTMVGNDEWIDTVAAEFGLLTVYEIGSVAYQRARLPRAARGPFVWPRM